MLTKSHLSHIMVMKINTQSKIRFTVPVALWVIDEIIGEFQDLICIFEGLFPKWNENLVSWASNHIVDHAYIEEFSLSSILKLMDELFNEMRRHGRWKLAEIDTKDIQLKVEFF